MSQTLTVVVPTNKKQHIKNLLTEESFLAFCQENYFNPECSGKNEFIDDLKRIKYIKRLIQKIHKQKTLKSIRERLIINHIIILKNVFGEENCIRILFFKLEPRLHSYLKSFLVYLEFSNIIFPEAEYRKINTDPRVDRKLNTPQT